MSPMKQSLGWSAHDTPPLFVGRRNREICNAYQQGDPVSVLHERFGLSHRKLRRILFNGGVKMRSRGKGHRINAELLARNAAIVTAWRRGWSMRRLAAAHGLHITSIWRICTKDGAHERTNGALRVHAGAGEHAGGRTGAVQPDTEAA